MKLAAIRRLRAQGLSRRAIALTLGLHEATINRMVEDDIGSKRGNKRRYREMALRMVVERAQTG